MAENELEFLRKELEKAQVILAFVLYVGGTVEIPKSVIAAGLPVDAVIAIDDNLENDSLVCRLEVQ